MPDEVIRRAVIDGVAEVRLNRPERRNAFNDDLFDGLLRVAAELRDDPAVRAIVLSGEGPVFCAGMDTSAFDAMRDAGADATWRPPDADAAAAAIIDIDGLALGRGQRVVLAWASMPVPVIAAVHGAAVGLGLQLALGADIRIVTPDAILGAWEIRWGLAPDSGGTQLLQQLIGFDRALELCTTGRGVSGAEAQTMGLATTVAADPRAAAMELAGTIAGRSPDAVRSIVRLLRMGRARLAPEGLLAERAEMGRNVGSAEQREAVAAARAGRPPVFGPP
jgi:enoyl-CoA hydratase/carnithine racemase